MKVTVLPLSGNTNDFPIVNSRVIKPAVNQVQSARNYSREKIVQANRIVNHGIQSTTVSNSIDSRFRKIEIKKQTTILPTRPPKESNSHRHFIGKARNAAGTLESNLQPVARSIEAPPIKKKADPSGSFMLRTCPELLTECEKQEIMSFQSVYYIGTQKSKWTRMALKDFDDSKGDYLFIPGEQLQFRYEVQNILGQGSFGQVFTCLDHKTEKQVAVKLIRNLPKFHTQAAVEIEILQIIRNRSKGGPSILCLESFSFRNHSCLVFEMYSMNLYELIKLMKFQPIHERFASHVTLQLFEALVFFQDNGILHCDVKPENILLEFDPLPPSADKQPDFLLLPDGRQAIPKIKVIDFGSSCLYGKQVFTYIQSRFYRAPEVILGVSYNHPIDVWSTGCVVAELLSGVPIFPGSDEYEQLEHIVEFAGEPEQSLLERASRAKKFFVQDDQGAWHLIHSKKKPGSKNMPQYLSRQITQFIIKCLTLDPDHRLTPLEGWKLCTSMVN